MSTAEAALVVAITLLVTFSVVIVALWQANHQLKQFRAPPPPTIDLEAHNKMIAILQELLMYQSKLLETTTKDIATHLRDTVTETVKAFQPPLATNREVDDYRNAVNQLQHLQNRADLYDWTDDLLPPGRQDTELTTQSGSDDAESGPVSLSDEAKAQIFGIGDE